MHGLVDTTGTDITDETAHALRATQVDSAGNPIQANNPLPTSSVAQPSTWSETALSGSNAAVTVTRAGESGKSHYITAIIVSINGAGAGLAQFKDNDITKAQGYARLDANFVVPLPAPYKCVVGAPAALTMAAAGVGVISAVTLVGYTI